MKVYFINFLVDFLIFIVLTLLILVALQGFTGLETIDTVLLFVIIIGALFISIVFNYKVYSKRDLVAMIIFTIFMSIIIVVFFMFIGQFFFKGLNSLLEIEISRNSQFEIIGVISYIFVLTNILILGTKTGNELDLLDSKIQKDNDVNSIKYFIVNLFAVSLVIFAIGIVTYPLIDKYGFSFYENILYIFLLPFMLFIWLRSIRFGASIDEA